MVDVSTCSATICAHLCGDGTCKDRASDCRTASGCPVTSPYRCADGSCREYPSIARVDASKKCASEVVCNEMEVACYNRECGLSWNHCKRE